MWSCAITAECAALTGESPIAAPLVAWHAQYGRHDLPWQLDRTPYRVWVSEIMLQQTQVAAVVPYYERFMSRFPDVRALADAPLDDVLHLWSGLGYYARARNMHRAAARIRDEFGGQFPRSFELVAGLPGIGRSTAGAILALSRGERYAILDGNVKRVLSRFFGVDRTTSYRAMTDELWLLSERCTPRSDVDVYTQSIMDLGATVCTRHKPLCPCCPLATDCLARSTGRQQDFPARRPAREKKTRLVFVLVAMRRDGSVLLERRPDSGIWGGLWCLPEFDTASAAGVYAEHSLRTTRAEPITLASVQHAFTHFNLVITPLLVPCLGQARVMDSLPTLWYNTQKPARIGMPAPIKALLENLTRPTMFDESARTP